MAEEDNFFSRWSRRKAQAKEGVALPEAPHPAPLPKGEREQELPVPAESPPSLAPLAERGIEGRSGGFEPHAASPPSGPGLQARAPAAGEGPVAEEAPPLPTLADVAALTRDSDYKRFVVPGVDEGVKRAAMKKMFFSDPHFNVMDGLDTYIGDYNTPDPIPASMLRKMWQSKALGLFDDEEDEEKAPQLATAAQASRDGAAPAPLSQSSTEPAVPLDENPDLRLQPDDDPGRPGPDEGAGPERV
jgi:hypothetical protein